MKADIPPFYVGQKVVAIDSHSLGYWKKGDEFTVLSIKRGCCEWEIDIGIRHLLPFTRCGVCLSVFPSDFMYRCSRFRPLQEATMPLMTFSNIKEKEKEEILILN